MSDTLRGTVEDAEGCLGLRGLKYVSKNRRERVEAITRVLADSDYDIIALQELWVFADYEHVREALSKRLPYSKFFYRCAYT